MSETNLTPLWLTTRREQDSAQRDLKYRRLSINGCTLAGKLADFEISPVSIDPNFESIYTSFVLAQRDDDALVRLCIILRQHIGLSRLDISILQARSHHCERLRVVLNV